MQKCILVYDDDVEISMLCKLILQKLNYKVETRPNCDSVIADIKTIKPDLILMDLWIPNIGGEEAVRQIHEDPSSKDIPILLFSANDEVEKTSIKLSTQGFIKKPFDIPQLKETIERWIEI